MATTSYITFLLFALTTASSMAMAADHVNPNSSKSHELQIATDEMARANYFTFVTLINIMSPLDNTLQQNVTFLMPNDRILSTTTIPSDFLLRHSIPSPLLFDHLQHIPSGSTIPSSDSDFKLYINNNGRRSFYLNNVRLISPNLCTAGHSIRCHGIDGVLAAPVTDTTPASSCSNSTTPVVTEAPPAPLLAPAAAPEPVQHIDLRKTSGSSSTTLVIHRHGWRCDRSNNFGWRRRPEAQYWSRKTSVWWDIENCQVPKSCDPHLIAQNISSAFVKLNYCGRSPSLCTATLIGFLNTSSKLSPALEYPLITSLPEFVVLWK